MDEKEDFMDSSELEFDEVMNETEDTEYTEESEDNIDLILNSLQQIQELAATLIDDDGDDEDNQNMEGKSHRGSEEPFSESEIGKLLPLDSSEPIETINKKIDNLVNMYSKY